MAQVTSPIILDSTGQQIHSDLQQIKNVLTTPSAAADITFNNTGTGMQADDVQDAITELKSNLTELMDITQWNHESVSVTPTSADTTWYNTAVFNGLKTAKIVVLETGDLQAIFMNDGSNIKMKTFSFMYSASNLSQYSTVIQLRVDFQNGKAGIRETYKASSGSYATLTDVYWI